MSIRNLYKYTTFETAVRILISEKIRFSSISLFNDPFEFRFDANNDKYSKRDHFKKYVTDNVGVFCSSKSHNNVLMLSHYSNQHKGWIIEFEFDEIPNQKTHNPLSVADLTNPSNGAMGYSEDVADISEYLNKLHDYMDGKGLKPTTSETDQNIYAVVGTKSKDWEYEQEVRFLTSLNSNKKYIDVDYKKCGMRIKSLYYGCRADEEDRKIISQILELKNEDIKIKGAVNYD